MHAAAMRNNMYPRRLNQTGTKDSIGRERPLILVLYQGEPARPDRGKKALTQRRHKHFRAPPEEERYEEPRQLYRQIRFLEDVRLDRR
jgi:hypothetical protein